jgi:hypothetical protein
MQNDPDQEAVDTAADMQEMLGNALETFQGGSTETEEGPGLTAADSGAGGGVTSEEVPPASATPAEPALMPSARDASGVLPPTATEPEGDPRLQGIASTINVTPEMVTAFKAENPMFAAMDDATAGQALRDIIASATLESQDLEEARVAAGEPPTVTGSGGVDFAKAYRNHDFKSLFGGIAAGVAKAGFETYDAVNELVLGNEADPSEWRQGVEKYYDNTSGVGGAAAVIAQWGITFVGIGKFAKLAKVPGLAASAGTRTGQVAQAAAKGAAADFLAFDGLQNRLSNIVQEYPALENPVTAYLAASPDDSQAEGRLKNALEGLGIGATLDVVLAGFRALRASRAGDKAGVDAAVDEATAAYDGIAKDPPPPAPGMVRVWHGGIDQPGARWVSTDRRYAEGYRDKFGNDQGKSLWYRDIPETDPRVNNPDPDLAELQGLKQGFHFSFELPEAEARAMSRLGDEVAVAEGAQTGRAPTDVPDVEATPRVADESLESQKAAYFKEGEPLYAELTNARTSLASTRTADDILADIARSDAEEAALDGFRSANDSGIPDFRADDNARISALNELARIVEEAANGSDIAKARLAKLNLTEEVKQKTDRLMKAVLAVNEWAAKPEPGRVVRNGAIVFSDPERAAQAAVREAPEPPTVTRTVEEPARPGIMPSLPREELQAAARAMTQDIIDNPLPASITPDVKQPIPSTFDSLTQADELKALIDATEKEMLVGINGSASAVGRVSIEETQRIAQQLAEDTGQNAGEFFVRMQRDADNIENLSARILAYDQVTRTLAAEVRDMAHAVRSGNPGQFGSMEALKDAFENRLAAYAQVQDWLKGVRSETGRALGIMRHSQALGQGIDVSNIANFGQGLGTAGRNVTVEELAEAVIMSGGNRKMLGRIANPTKYAQVRDALVSLFIKNILSGPTTHLVNILGNVSAALSHPASKIIGGAMHRNTLIMREGIQQYGFMVTESLQALKMAGEAYKRGYNILDPQRSKFHENGIFPEALTASKISGGVVPDDSVTGWLANGAFKAIDAVSTRALSASDEFFKQNLYASELSARAWADGVAQGLQGAELKAYIAEQRAAGFTTAPDVGANTAKIEGNANAEAAFNVARFSTFTQNVKPGGLASSVLYITNKHPELKFAVPFVRVVSNLLEFTGSMTPGIANLMTSYKQAIARGGRDAAVARGRLAIGFSAWTMAMSMAAGGQITGAGPVKSDGSPDYKRRQLLEQTGWKPNSLKIGDTYVNLSRLDPYGLIFNIAATAYDKFQGGMRDDKSWIDIAATMTFALAHTLGERQYLKGMADLMEALNDDTGHTFNRYLANLASSIVVPNFVRQAATVPLDPVMREARGVVESVMKRTPYLSDNLAARRMPWGEKMMLQPQLYNTASEDPLMREYARLLEAGHSGGGEPLPRMRPVPGGKSIDLAKTRVGEETLYDVYGDLIEQPDPSVPPLKQALRELIESDTYKNELIDGPGALKGTRLKAWQTIMSRYRSAAWRKVLELHPEVREQVYEKKQSVADQATAQRRAVEMEAFLDE